MNAKAPPETRSSGASGIYWGRVMHNRLAPRRNHFTYPVFVFALDLDAIGALERRLRLFGHNRFSLYSLRDADHLGDPRRPIKENVIALLRERGFTGRVDRVRMLTQLRVLGHVFNPVTFYYCYADGAEVAYVAEITNTFRQRHCYAFFGGGRSFEADKVFYVSPFVEMDVRYNFRFDPLGESLGVFVDDFEKTPGGIRPLLKTHIVGKYHPLTDAALLRSFLKLPFMSAWILAWIHWQALRLWLKKVRVVFRPRDGMKPGFTPGSGFSGGE